MMQNLSARTLLAVSLFALPVVSAAAPSAGQVIFRVGDVSAERAPPVSLAKGDEVFATDTVRTGVASRAQLLMKDGAKFAVRPQSVMRIDEFVYGSGETAAAAVVSQTGNRSVFTLLKGGFRTITGVIGKEDERAYEVRTAVGVLGIRGTDYTAVYCNSDCIAAPAGSSTAQDDGLYLGVTTGAIVFRNENGDIELAAGEYAFVPLATRRPERMKVPPPVLLDDTEGDGNTAGRPSPVGFDNRLGSRRLPEVNAAPYDDGDASDVGADGAKVPLQAIIATDAEGNAIDLTPGQPRDVGRLPSDNYRDNQGSSTLPRPRP